VQIADIDEPDVAMEAQGSKDSCLGVPGVETVDLVK
jgi:hypothetical protein